MPSCSVNWEQRVVCDYKPKLNSYRSRIEWIANPTLNEKCHTKNFGIPKSQIFHIPNLFDSVKRCAVANGICFVTTAADRTSTEAVLGVHYSTQENFLLYSSLLLTFKFFIECREKWEMA